MTARQLLEVHGIEYIPASQIQILETWFVRIVVAGKFCNQN